MTTEQENDKLMKRDNIEKVLFVIMIVAMVAGIFILNFLSVLYGK